MGIKKKFYKVLVLFIVFTMLSNYMLICSEFANIAIATDFSDSITSSLELNSGENDENTISSEESFENQEDIISDNTDESSINFEDKESRNLEIENLEQNLNNTGEENTNEVEDTVFEDKRPNNSLEEINRDSSIEEISQDENQELNNDIELEDIENEDSSNFDMFENYNENYNVNVDYNINRVTKFDNSLGKGLVLDTTFKIESNAQKEHNIKVELNLPKINEASPLKYNIEYISDNLSIMHNPEENIITLVLNKENANEEIRIVFLYDNRAYTGKEAILTGTIIKSDFIENEQEIIKENKIENEISNNIESQELSIEASSEYSKTSNKDFIEDISIIKEIKEEIGSTGKYSLNSDNTSKFKGLLYANLFINNKKDISFYITDTIEVEDADFIDCVEVDSKDLFINKNDEEIELQNGIVYKKLEILKEEFDSVLGENGYIEVLDSDGNRIGTIDDKNEIYNEKYIYRFPSLISNIKLRLRNIKNNGKLDIRVEKAISKNLNLEKEDILDLKSVISKNINRTKKVFDDIEVALQEITVQSEMKLEDTKTEISLDADTNSLSTQEENKVTYTINLKTNSEEYEVFKNPVIEMEFPYSVQDVEINNINLLHRNGLSLSNWGVEKNQYGDVTLRIVLEGSQEDYNPSSIIDGTTINLVTTIKVDRLATSEGGNIKLRYSNEAGTKLNYELQSKDSEEYEVKYVSNSELLTVTNFEGFNDNFEVLSEINSEKLVGKADVGGEKKISTVNLNIINNLKEDINDVVILGKLPVVGNIDNNGNSLNTTIDAVLSSEITTSGILSKIYYSEELNAEIGSDNWKEKLNDISKAKCFKIVLESNIMHQGDSINISYDLVIPENLDYNQNIYGLNTICYKLNDQEKIKDIIIGIETETKEIKIEDFEEVKETEKLAIGTKITRGSEEVKAGESVNERQILRYTTIIQNISNEPINNLKLQGNAHNANMFYWYTYNVISSSTGEETTTGEWIEDKDGSHKYDSLEIASIEPGESRIFEYQVIVNDLSFLQDFNDKTVYGNISLEADGIDKQEIETAKNPIVDGEIEIHLYKTGLEDINNMIISSGSEYDLNIYVKNITENDLKNVEVNMYLPNNVNLNSVTTFIHSEYNLSVRKISTGSIVTIVLDELKANDSQMLYLYTLTDSLDLSIASAEITVFAEAIANNKKYISNDYTRTIVQTNTKFDLNFYGNKENGSKVKEGEKLEYTFTAKNIGLISKDALFEYYFKSGLDINNVILFREDGNQEVLYNKENKTVNEKEDNNKLENKEFIEKRININPKETIKIVIGAEVSIEKAINEQEKIVNSVYFLGSKINQEITYFIEYPEEKAIIQDDYNSNVPKEEIINNFKTDDVDGNKEVNDKSSDEEKIDNATEIVNDKQELFYNTDANSNEKEKSNLDLTKTETVNQDEITTSNEEKAIVINSEKKNILYSPSNNSNSNMENIASKIETETNETYSISGTVWIDENKDGNIGGNEGKVTNIKVDIYKENGTKVLQSTYTDKIGKYIFTNLSKGNYVLLFSYDNEKYCLSTSENTSQNIISTKTINNKKYGISDIITISNNNISNVNMGLRSNDKFDLEIKSYISKLKVKTSKGTEEYTYNEEDFAKLEISSKYIEGAEITATFNIKIVNNGNISGYATSIKNNTSGNWTFDEKLNKDWKVGNDGNIYCNVLEDIAISPKDYKVVKLILTRTMTEDDTGVFTNTIELVNTKNAYKLLDYNSGNDKSNIEFMISIKTGIISYIAIICCVIISMTILLYIINLKLLNKLNKKNKRRFIIIVTLLFILVIGIVLSIQTFSVYQNSDEEELLHCWGAGMNESSIWNNDTLLIDHTTTYSRINYFMTQFYGVGGTRSAFLATARKFHETYGNDGVRTVMCIDYDNITPINVNYYGSNKPSLNNYSSWSFITISVLDAGWNEASTPYFNNMYGNFYTGLYTNGNSNHETERKTSWEAQVLGYAGYALENPDVWKNNWKLYNYADGSSGSETLRILFNYGQCLRVLLRNFDSMLDCVAYVGGVPFNGPFGNNFNGKNQEDLACFRNEVITFNEQTANVFGLNSFNVNEDNIKIKDTANNNCKLDMVGIGNETYISGIKAKFPIYGNNGTNTYHGNGTTDNINNKVILKYSTNGGKSYSTYTKDIWIEDNSGNLVRRSQNSTYGLNNGNTFVNKMLYIPINSNGINVSENDLDNVKFKIENSYYTYESRTLFMFKVDTAQNQGLLRGRTVKRSNESNIYAFDRTVKINKTVQSVTTGTDTTTVSGNTVPYAEVGSTVRYKIVLTNTGGSKISNIRFNDSHANLIYSSCHNDLSTSTNGNSFIYSKSIAKNSSATVWIEYKVSDSINPNTTTSLTNTVTVTNIKGKNNGDLTSSATINIRKYSYSINKYIHIIDSDIYYDVRPNYTATQKLSNKAYADLGSRIVYRIVIKNTGNSDEYGDIKEIVLSDTFNTNELEFTGATDDYRTGYETNGTKGDWTISNSNGTVTLTYGGTISYGNNAMLYISFNNKKIAKTSEAVTNNISTSSYKNRNDINVKDKSTSTSVFTSSDTFYTRTYKARVYKWLTRVDPANPIDENDNVVYHYDYTDMKYVEVGDVLKYRLELQNTGTGDEAGVIKDFSIIDDLINNVKNETGNYLVFEGIREFDDTEYRGISNGVATSNNWSLSKNSENQLSITYTGELKPTDKMQSGTHWPIVYVKFRVVNADYDNKVVTNKATITKIKNIKDIEIYNSTTNYLKDDSILTDEDDVTLKKYSVNVLKYIDSVTSLAGTVRQTNSSGQGRDIDKSPEVVGEYGDDITFKIVVTNTGDNADLYGAIKGFDLKDIFPEEVFLLVGLSENATWLPTEKAIRYTGGVLNIGESTTITLKLRVVGVDESLKDVNGDMIAGNIANLTSEESHIYNKNNIEIKDILNGTLEDSDYLTILITRLHVTKYITKLNTESIMDRLQKTNSEKFASPVEVEKYDTVTYTVQIDNVGRANIYKFILKDILDDGIEFAENPIQHVSLYDRNNANNVEDITDSVVFTKLDNTTGNINYPGSVNKDETIIIDFNCKIAKTNLYLFNLANTVLIDSVKNKNDLELVDTPFLELKRNDNKDYVRLKNLPVSGTVWLDENLNGLKDDGEKGIPGVKITLFDDTNGKKILVTTDNDGKYVFTETNGDASRANATNLDKKMVLSDGRVIKATGRDETTGNYNDSSQYINYYIAFEYNGGQYETIPLSVYANDKNITGSDNSYNDKYEKDSNAIEDVLLRNDFNAQLETIAYNEGIDKNGVSKVLEYDKNGHESKINITNDTAASMFAYSFMDETKTATDGIQEGDLRYLWFKDSNGNYDGETEYLKYINVGLTERRFDLKIEQDVYSVKNTINGQEMTYNFNQRDLSDEFGGEYILGGEREDYSTNPYQFRLYNSDYYYNSSLYSNEVVRNAKENTELSTEITYRVIITNEDLDDNKNVYATIREIADHYSNNFMKLGTYKYVKMLEGTGALTGGKRIDAVKAWYNKNGTKHSLTVSDNNQYGEVKNFDDENYNTLYITGFNEDSSNEIILNEGESFEFYIKFAVDTDENERIKLGSENNVVEINAYSTYKQNNDPAGYIDRDSNPGNITIINRIDEYEDDTYRTGIDLTLETKERTLSGVVWDDSRTESLDESNVTTMGMSNTHNSSIDGEENTDDELNNQESNSPNTPTIITSATYSQYYGDGKYDTSVIKDNEGKTNARVTEILGKDENKDIPVQDVKVSMVEIIKVKTGPGEFRYYEESINPWIEGGHPSGTTDENGNYVLTSFIPGKYETHYDYGYAEDENVTQNMQVFNGHDYKSTMYNVNIDSKTTDDDVLNELRKAGSSDARDDEIRRLEVIDYSEIMTNSKVENLQRTSTKITEKQFADDTAMFARTHEYKINIEDVAGNINTYSFNDYISLQNGDEPRFNIENIDFGIEYRPETSLLLQKFISKIRVILSTGEDLVNIKYNYIREGGNNTMITGTAIDKANSIGTENLQELRTVGNVKGFDYLNIDTDLLQGATVQIEYLLLASNESEIDRISRNLNGLMFKDDADSSYGIYMENDYTASGTAKNQLIAEYYGDTYNSNNKSRNKALEMFDGTSGYYGKYLGSMYYTGNKGNDVVAKLKVDKIIDYVDTDISFNENENHSEDNNWKSINSKQLIDGGYISESVNLIDGKLVDSKGIYFSVNDDEENEISNLAVSVNDRKSISDVNVLNKSISKYLLPSSVNNTDNYGIITLLTSKVLASETDTDNMRYDNTSEVIQYTSQTGRATQMKSGIKPLGQTLGNVDPSSNDLPDEPDSSFTETITLTPPTGLDRANYYIRVYMDYAIVIIAVILLTSSGIFVGRKIKNYKKFYK